MGPWQAAANRLGLEATVSREVGSFDLEMAGEIGPFSVTVSHTPEKKTRGSIDYPWGTHGHVVIPEAVLPDAPFVHLDGPHTWKVKKRRFGRKAKMAVTTGDDLFDSRFRVELVELTDGSPTATEEAALFFTRRRRAAFSTLGKTIGYFAFHTGLESQETPERPSLLRTVRDYREPDRDVIVARVNALVACAEELAAG